jgi:hypothetical protein
MEHPGKDTGRTEQEPTEGVGAEETGIEPADATPERGIEPPESESPDSGHVVEEKGRD